MFFPLFEKSIEKMARDSTYKVKFVNTHPLRIDVVKFNSKSNFSMWRCEVMDALTTSNLEDALLLKRKIEETSEKDWNKMNRTACDVM